MTKRYFYDVTDYRFAKGITKDNWDIDDFMEIKGFMGFLSETATEIIESREKVDGIQEIPYEQVKDILVE